jgi:hypothetical protein
MNNPPTAFRYGNFGGDNNVTATYAVNTWHHIVVACNRTGATTGQYSTYLNNNLVGSATANFPQSGAVDYQLFRGWQSAPCSQYAMIDLVYFYNRVLSASEVSTLYNSGSGI